ncbi:hypothetical protein [Streptomyces sp. NPDC058872]|uniref:hypothetical protein n=1 Tax=Streptomyces sp. NPDC058872 TaxID=3346661 RepID=UPI003674397A
MNNPIPTPTFGDQNGVLELFVWLALEQPSLPTPYISFARYSTPYVTVSVDHGDFEAWRTALGFDAAEVRLRSTETYSFLDIGGVYSKTLGRREVSCRVVLSGSGLPILAERPAAELVERAA